MSKLLVIFWLLLKSHVEIENLNSSLCASVKIFPHHFLYSSCMAIYCFFLKDYINSWVVEQPWPVARFFSIWKLVDLLTLGSGVSYLLPIKCYEFSAGVFFQFSFMLSLTTFCLVVQLLLKRIYGPLALLMRSISKL